MRNIPKYTVETTKLLSGFDGIECKFYPRLVKIDDKSFISYCMILRSGSDVFNDTYFIKSTDGGKSYTTPEKLRRIETNENGIRTIFTGSTEYYSKYHKTWFVFGRTTSYEHDKHPILLGGVAIGKAEYLTRDIESGHYIGDTVPLPIPFDYISATPHAQIVEFDNGDFLLTYYITPANEIKLKALSIRYKYENGKLSIVEAGEALPYPDAKRGLDEPSLAKFGDKYYLTLRTDEQGLISTSDDGLNFTAPTPWKWDDGSILQNYNTMQHWIRHKDALYLVYTRRGANNDHIFRHRAPLFMARFDEKNMCLIKDSEIILVPELGADLGNFSVTELSENEFLVLTAEWMYPKDCEKLGSDNSIWHVKIKFDK